jgi:hypothetical protein
MHMDLGIVAFWFFVAAAVVGSMWRKKHSEAMRHETIRMLIEKGHKIDEEQLNKILNPVQTPSSEWLMGLTAPKDRRGDFYRALRVTGTILLFAALGLGLMALWRGLFLGFHDKDVMDIGMAVPMVAVLGIGLFFSSRFVPKPPSDINKEKQDQ